MSKYNAMCLQGEEAGIYPLTFERKALRFDARRLEAALVLVVSVKGGGDALDWFLSQ